MIMYTNKIKKIAIAAMASLSMFACCMPVAASETEDLFDMEISENMELDNDLSLSGDIAIDEGEEASLEEKKDEIADEMEEGVTALSDGSIGSTRYTSLLDIACADSDTYFEKMKTSLQNGESISFANLIEESGGALDNIDQNLFDITKVSGYDNIDFDAVNMDYSSAVAMLSDVYTSIDMTGMSQGCLELFNNTYGNLLDELQLDEPTLPDGFSMDAIMSSAESAVSDAYSSAISSGDFATVRSQISMSDVMSLMNQAAKGAESYSLPTSYSELQSKAQSNGKNAYTDVRGTYSVDISNAQKMVNQTAASMGNIRRGGGDPTSTSSGDGNNTTTSSASGRSSTGGSGQATEASESDHPIFDSIVQNVGSAATNFADGVMDIGRGIGDMVGSATGWW